MIIEVFERNSGESFLIKPEIVKFKTYGPYNKLKYDNYPDSLEINGKIFSEDKNLEVILYSTGLYSIKYLVKEKKIMLTDGSEGKKDCDKPFKRIYEKIKELMVEENFKI